MFVGLVAVARPTRPRPARRVLPVAGATLVGVALSLVLLVAATVAAQEGQGAAPASDEELVDQLADLEDQLRAVALLPDVTVAPETTWGTITGDFVGARVVLDDATADLRLLVGGASDAASPVADAVAVVASAYRTMHQGYAFLAAFEQAGLGTAPTDAEVTVVTATDDPRGQAEIGLNLLLEALAGFHDGYAVLRDADAAADHRALFEERYAAVQSAAQADGASARMLLAYPSTEVLVAVSRFDPAFGDDNPAQIARYLCADRDDYLDQRPEGPVEDLPIPEGDQPDLPFPDCPALDNGNDVRPVAAGVP